MTVVYHTQEKQLTPSTPREPGFTFACFASSREVMPRGMNQHSRIFLAEAQCSRRNDFHALRALRLREIPVRNALDGRRRRIASGGRDGACRGRLGLIEGLQDALARFAAVEDGGDDEVGAAYRVAAGEDAGIGGLPGAMVG